VSHKHPLSAILLAGGRSSRMGTDKALLTMGSETVLESTVALLSPLFEEVLVVVDKKSKCDGLNLKKAKICEDIFESRGPLGGLYTGLSYANFHVTVAFTCDMPFVDEVLIEQLIRYYQKEEDAVYIEDSEGKQYPFPGIYTRACKQIAHLLMEGDDFSMKRFLEMIISNPLILQKEERKVLTNMNTIQDYHQVLKEKKETVKNE
jgi:molybdenum cofactor guanylyltransferase